MIKIRYADLPAGLHVRAVASGKDTIVYLLPGLTVAQRRAALRRARSSSRMGHGPRLPAGGLAGAVVADRVRTTVRNTAAALRGHPTIFLPPIVIIVSAAIAYVLLASVSSPARPPLDGGHPNPFAAPITAAVVPPVVVRPSSAVLARTSPGRAAASSPQPRRRPGSGHRSADAPPYGSPLPSPSPVPTSAGVPPGQAPVPSPTPLPPVPSAGPPSQGTASGAAGDSELCLTTDPLEVCLPV